MAAPVICSACRFENPAPGTEALRLAERTESRKYVAEARGLRAVLLWETGARDEAVVELQAALHAAEAIGYARGIWQHAGALGRVLSRMGREADARAAYRTTLDTLGRTLPRIPDPGLRETLLASEPVARLREEAGTLGVTP